MNQISVLSDSVYFIIMHQGVNLHLGHVILRARSNEVNQGQMTADYDDIIWSEGFEIEVCYW